MGGQNIVQSSRVGMCRGEPVVEGEDRPACRFGQVIGQQPFGSWFGVREAAAHRTLFQQIMDLTLEDKDNQEIAAIVADTAHQVFDLLEPALTDYAVRTQPS